MLTVYVKPTNFCNVGCDHCYLPLDTRADKNRMSEEKLYEVAGFIKDLKKREGHAQAQVIWHGGEPMVLTPEYFLSAGKIFDEVLGYQQYYESIQTSLIPYTSDWAGVVHERFDGHIGSSIDFSLRAVKGSYDDYIALWMKKVNMARNDGIMVIPGMVPTRNEVGKGEAIVSWMIENDFSAFNVDRYSAVGSTKSIDRPSNALHARFLIELFDASMNNMKAGRRTPAINVVASGIGGVLNGLPGDRWGTSCQRDFVVIEPDGSTNTCPDRARHEAPFSNTSQGAVEFSISDSRRKWIVVQDITHKKQHCLTCEYRPWCKSGCPVTPNGAPDGEVECSGYKTYLNHIKSFCENEENRLLCQQYLNGK